MSTVTGQSPLDPTKDSIPLDHEVTYVKARHKQQTIFVECNEEEMVESLRKKLEMFFPFDTRLFYRGMMLDDPTSLYNQSVLNGAEVWVVTKQSAYDNNWQTLEEAGFPGK